MPQRQRLYDMDITDVQRSNMALIKSRLGEHGYHIFNVAAERRRHQMDILALDSKAFDTDQSVLLIYPGWSEAIVVQPWVNKENARRLIKFLPKKRHRDLKLRIVRPFSSRSRWQDWLSPASLEEARLLQVHIPS
jgi:hypothetical protein